MTATTGFKQMDPYCDRHGTWHAPGACALIDELRARVVPAHPDQMMLQYYDPSVLCFACGATVDGTAMFCDPCEATIRRAEHTGDTDTLTDGQRAVLGLRKS